MAEATAAPTARKATKAAPRKAPAKKAPATPAATTTEVDYVAFALEPDSPTKNFARFKYPEGSGCVGTMYAPLGTKVVKVRLER